MYWKNGAKSDPESNVVAVVRSFILFVAKCDIEHVNHLCSVAFDLEWGVEMSVLLVGLAIFFAIHLVRMVAPDTYANLSQGKRQAVWKGLYAIVSLVGLVLIILGWGIYRPDAPELFTPPKWGSHAALLLVLVAFILITAAYLPRGRIKATLGHPMIMGIMLWSAGHLVANGDLASLLVFGSFLVYAVWNRVAVATRPLPQGMEIRASSDLIAAIVGAAVFFLVVYWVHPWLFGVSPI